MSASNGVNAVSSLGSHTAGESHGSSLPPDIKCAFEPRLADMPAARHLELACPAGAYQYQCIAQCGWLVLLACLQDGDDSAAAVLSSMLLLPDDFQPTSRMQAHNSCVHRALDNPQVKVCGLRPVLKHQSVGV